MQESKTKSLIGETDEFLIMENVENVLLFDSYILFCQKKLFVKIDNSTEYTFSKICEWLRIVNPAGPPKQIVRSETNEGATVCIKGEAPYV